jgi:hypothetical protein
VTASGTGMGPSFRIRTPCPFCTRVLRFEFVQGKAAGWHAAPECPDWAQYGAFTALLSIIAAGTGAPTADDQAFAGEVLDELERAGLVVKR